MLPSDWFSSANNCFREDSGFCGNSFLSPMLCRLVDLNSHVVVSKYCQINLWSLMLLHVFEPQLHFVTTISICFSILIYLEASSRNSLLHLEAALLLMYSLLADSTPLSSFVVHLWLLRWRFTCKTNGVLFDNFPSSRNLYCLSFWHLCSLDFRRLPPVSRKLGRSGSILTRGLDKRHFLVLFLTLGFAKQLLCFSFHQGLIIT